MMGNDEGSETTSISAGNGHSGASNGARLAVNKFQPSTISNQLREELIRILTTGDEKHDGAFTVTVSAQVEKFVIASREILMAEDLAKKDLASLMMMRKNQYGAWGGAVLGGLGGGIGDPYPMPGLVNNENFGVQAIRQLVDAVKTMGDSPAKLVEALAVARKNDLTDVVASLEKKLGIAKDDEAAVDGDAHAHPHDRVNEGALQ